MREEHDIAAGDRRPLSSRNTGWARAITRRLVATSITPNQISMASIVAAAVAGLCFWASGSADGALRGLLLGAAALCCQLRLLCNLFDGLVAVEGGKQTADGAFWNEFPDRVADILILVGAGLGVGLAGLGWAAAAMAVLTAYTRELGRGAGLPADFSGPMAKQHRMAVVTLAAALAIAEPVWSIEGKVMTAALWIVTAGAAATAARRAARIVAGLRRRGGAGG